MTEPGAPHGKTYFITVVEGPIKRGPESLVAEAFQANMPVIGVANPTEVVIHEGALPKLHAPEAGWRAVVDQAIALAEVIVVDLWSYSTSIADELDMVLDRDGSSRTILLLPHEGFDLAGDHDDEILAALGAAPGSAPRRIRTPDGVLARFPWSIRQEDLDVARLRRLIAEMKSG